MYSILVQDKMKRLFLLLLTLFSVMGMQAADVYTLGYCDHKIANSNGQGADTAGEISAAIFVPQSKLKTLAGNEISRIDVGLISRINVRSLTVWVRQSLEGQNLTETSIERGALGWNEVTLTHPYTIGAEGEGLYIGFTYTNTGTSHPVSFVEDGTKGTSFLKSSADAAWKDMAEYGNLSLEAIVTGNSLPLYDLSLNSISLTPNIALGEMGYRVTGSVSNVAIRDVSGFTLSLESADGSQQQVKVDREVKSGATCNFTADFVSACRLNGLVKATITAINEGSDANMDNNSATGSVAFLRNVLVEEFTTERCSNCPGAANGLHQTLTSSDLYATRVIAVCHHAGFYTDGYTRDCDKELLFLYNDGGSTYAPGLMFDRQPMFDSNYLSGQKDNVAALHLKEDFIECIDKAMAIPTHALVGISVKEVKANGEGHELTVEVSVLADDECKLENPILTVYATEDDILSTKQSGASGDFYHQHVIRWDNGAWGDEVTFADHTFSKTYTLTLDKAWDAEKMHFVAVLSNHDASNPLNNAVENAANIDLGGITTAIKDMDDVDAPVVIGRYGINGSRVNAAYKGVTIIKYSNGKGRTVIN